MTRDLTPSNGIGSLLSGKARTVAAVAAFSGLAIATTVSVQAAPAQDASADAPLSAVAAATPTAAPTVSLEPVAHVTKAGTRTDSAAASQVAPQLIRILIGLDQIEDGELARIGEAEHDCRIAQGRPSRQGIMDAPAIGKTSIVLDPDSLDISGPLSKAHDDGPVIPVPVSVIC